MWSATLERFGSAVEEQRRVRSATIDLEDSERIPAISFKNSLDSNGHTTNARSLDEQINLWQLRVCCLRMEVLQNQDPLDGD